MCSSDLWRWLDNGCARRGGSARGTGGFAAAAAGAFAAAAAAARLFATARAFVTAATAKAFAAAAAAARLFATAARFTRRDFKFDEACAKLMFKTVSQACSHSTNVSIDLSKELNSRQRTTAAAARAFAAAAARAFPATAAAAARAFATAAAAARFLLARFVGSDLDASTLGQACVRVRFARSEEHTSELQSP